MFEAYKIAVRVAIVDELSAPIALLAQHLIKTEAAAARLQTRLTAMRSFFMGGVGLLGASATIAAPLIYAIDKAAELQKQMIAVQIATRGTTGQMTSLRSAIESVAGQTVFSNIDVAKMAKAIATGTGFGAAQLQGVLPAYVKYADVQMLMKGTPYAQSVTDAIRAAHGAQHYDPASLTKFLDLLNKASLMIPGSTTEVVRALAYSQGIAKTALGSSDENNILMITLLNRMGFAGTRGGTNLIAAMTRTIPGVFGSGLLKGKGYESLAFMNMIDAKGHAKVFGKDGKFDPVIWMGLMADYVAKEFASHPEAIARQDIMKNFQRAYGTIGSRPASLLSSPQAIEQFRMMSEMFSQFGGFEGMQKLFADESAWQQWRNTMTNFQSAMVELGLTLLPTVSAGLKKLNTYLGELIQWMTKNPGEVKRYAKDIAYFVLALGALGAISITTSAVLGLVSAVTLLKNAAVGTASAAGAGGAKGVLGKVGAGVGMFGVGYAAGSLAWDYGLEDTKAGDAIGRYVARIMASLGVKEAQESLNQSGDAWSDLIHGKVHRPVQVHTTINIDGKKVAHAVTHHVAKAAQEPQTGINDFDGREALVPAGAGNWK